MRHCETFSGTDRTKARTGLALIVPSDTGFCCWAAPTAAVLLLCFCRFQRRSGVTFVLLTHEKEEALIVSDGITVMFEGENAEFAIPQELYCSPASRAVGGFIATMNVLFGRLEQDTPSPVTVAMKNLISHPVLDPGARVRVAWEPKFPIVYTA